MPAGRWFVRRGLFICVSILSEKFGQLAIVDAGSGRDIGVALQNLQRLLKRLDDFRERAASLRDVLGLAKGVEDGLVFVDLLVKLGLELLLAHADHEVSNQFGDGFADRTDRDLEDGVDTGADLLNEDIGCAGRASVGGHLLLLLLLLLRVLLGNGHAVLIVLHGHGLFSRHD